MTTNVYIPILTIPTTNKTWLNELLDQLDQLSGVTVHLVHGADNKHELPRRRAQILEEAPAGTTHVFFIDPDDLIDVDVIQKLIDGLNRPGVSGIWIKEKPFGENIGDNEGYYCCRVIAQLKDAQRAGRMTLAYGMRDKSYVQRLDKSFGLIKHPGVGYYWRRHENQITRTEK